MSLGLVGTQGKANLEALLGEWQASFVKIEPLARQMIQAGDGLRIGERSEARNKCA